MCDDWEVYFTHVDGHPASILLDMDIEAPIPGLSIMAYVTLEFRDPDGNGMSRCEESATLTAIEDALVSALTHDTCLFVGCCTTDGQREFFFYMDDAEGVEDKVETIMAAFDEYAWDMGLVEEPGWDTYLDFLYPDEQGMDTIRNNRIRRQLAEHGDNSAAPRTIEHWFAFPSAADRAAFMAEVEAEGFCAILQDSDPETPFGLQVQREDTPDDIDDVTWPLRSLATAHSGRYDGWDCAVVT